MHTYIRAYMHACINSWTHPYMYIASLNDKPITVKSKFTDKLLMQFDTCRQRDILNDGQTDIYIYIHTHEWTHRQRYIIVFRIRELCFLFLRLFKPYLGQRKLAQRVQDVSEFQKKITAYSSSSTYGLESMAFPFHRHSLNRKLSLEGPQRIIIENAKRFSRQAGNI